MQSGRPSPSLSVSALPQPHTPGMSLSGSFGQPSWQSAVPSPSVSVSGTPQPHWPGATFNGSFGQPSMQSGVPSPSVSTSGNDHVKVYAKPPPGLSEAGPAVATRIKYGVPAVTVTV